MERFRKLITNVNYLEIQNAINEMISNNSLLSFSDEDLDNITSIINKEGAKIILAKLPIESLEEFISITNEGSCFPLLQRYLSMNSYDDLRNLSHIYMHFSVNDDLTIGDFEKYSIIFSNKLSSKAERKIAISFTSNAPSVIILAYK